MALVMARPPQPKCVAQGLKEVSAPPRLASSPQDAMLGQASKMMAVLRRALLQDFDHTYLPGGDPPSAACIDLIERMLRANPEERASCGEITTHPWFLTVREAVRGADEGSCWCGELMRGPAGVGSWWGVDLVWGPETSYIDLKLSRPGAHCVIPLLVPTGVLPIQALLVPTCLSPPACPHLLVPTGAPHPHTGIAGGRRHHERLLPRIHAHAEQGAHAWFPQLARQGGNG